MIEPSGLIFFLENILLQYSESIKPVVRYLKKLTREKSEPVNVGIVILFFLM